MRILMGVMRVNVKSALYGIQEILPHFKSRDDGQIINISSMLGRIPFAVVRSAYSGAKHFLDALTSMFRDEVRQTHPGIQFSLVSPGVVRTDFGLNAIHGGLDNPAPARIAERGRSRGRDRERHRVAVARRVHAAGIASNGGEILRDGWSRSVVSDASLGGPSRLRR
jgi:NAD(P)-dependent dehydrogenase (short-subunit alcohol dehydrogenase family)